MERRLLLDVVVREGSAVLELLAGENQSLLVRRDTLLVLDLGLDVVDRVSRLDLKGDRLASQRLDKDLHLEENERSRQSNWSTPSKKATSNLCNASERWRSTRTSTVARAQQEAIHRADLTRVAMDACDKDAKEVLYSL